MTFKILGLISLVGLIPGIYAIVKKKYLLFSSGRWLPTPKVNVWAKGTGALIFGIAITLASIFLFWLFWFY